MKKKKLLLFSFAIVPLLMACASPIDIDQGIELAKKISDSIMSDSFKKPTRFQITFNSEKDYLDSDNYETVSETFVCDTDGYKIYSSVKTISFINDVKTKKVDTTYNWLDSDWTFHTAFENETTKSHKTVPANKESGILIFHNAAASKFPNPVSLTQSLLFNVINYFSSGEISEQYLYSFASNGDSNLKFSREQIEFTGSQNGLSKNSLDIEIKDNLIYRGWIEQKNRDLKQEISFTYTIGNVSVKLPNIETW